MDERSIAAYDYELPAALIAQSPARRRDGARLMIVRDEAFADRTFAELAEILRPGDLLVLNETRVIRARLGARRESGGRVEVLLLHPQGGGYDPHASAWRALVRPAKRVREGDRLSLYARDGEALGSATITRTLAGGLRELHLELALAFEPFLERAGRLPLPPYIHNESEDAQERYQTVFARMPGSVAAPTAALHFTRELLERLESRGIEIAKLSLDVGLGTFAPMRGARIDEHEMHAERYAIPSDTAGRIARARAEGRRIVAAGTTVVRALEDAALAGSRSKTALFIAPGFRFRVVDAMITNFHLPRSTLLVLVSAFAGRDLVLRAYRAAIDRGYRFFSFGDAMLLQRRERRDSEA
ncbi:MAG TPA: tRNA preQ1(34) S-adenosylmethionine ribosyltransferase-isomerase QueA [Candidatus Tyrphobacter sp.]